MKQNISQQSRLAFLILGVISVVLAFLLVQPLVSLIILALLVTMLFHPVYKRLLKIFKGIGPLATTSTLLIIVLSVIVPLALLFTIIGNQVSVFINDLNEFSGVNAEQNQQNIFEPLSVNLAPGLNIEYELSYGINKSTEYYLEKNPENEVVTLGGTDVSQIIDDINSFLTQIPFIEYELTIDDVRNAAGQIAVAVAQFLGTRILSFATELPVLLTNLLVFVILVVALLPSQEKIKSFILQLSPLSEDINMTYLRKIRAMSISMIRGTFVMAIILGFVSWLIFSLAGVGYAVFWALLAGIFSIIPSGAGFVGWPIVVALLISGNFAGAIIVLLGFLVVLTIVDSVLRPKLVLKEAHLHPALILVSIVAGLQTFGLLGFIYGPVILIFLFTTFEVYIKHFQDKEKTELNKLA